MPVFEYGVLSAWLDYWEELLGEPRDLLLGNEHFANVVQASIDALEERHRQKDYDPDWRMADDATNPGREMIGHLQEAFEAPEHPAIGLLEIERRAEVGELRGLLRDPPYGVARIRELLDGLDGLPSAAVLREQMRRELKRGNDADRPKLGAIAAELARRGLDGFRHREVRELPRRVLARAGVLTLLEEPLAELAADPGKAARVRTIGAELLGSAAASEGVTDALDAGAPDLFGVFADKVLWVNITYRLMDEMRELWATTLEEVGKSEGEAGTVAGGASLLADDEVRLERLGLSLVERYVRNFLRQVLDLTARGQRQRPGSAINAFGRDLASLLHERGMLRDYRGRGRGTGLWRADELAARALGHAVAAELSRACAAHFVATEGRDRHGPTARSIALRLTQLLVEEAGRGTEEVDGAASTPDQATPSEEASAVLTRWSSRRRVHEALSAALASLNGELLAQAASMSEQAGAGFAGQEFWRRWARSFSRDVRDPRYLPWDGMDAGTLDAILDGLFEAIEGTGEAWLVLFTVQDLDPEGLRWRAGAVTFYDPREFDSGEGRWLELRGHPTEDAARAAVFVSAETREAARLAAGTILEGALDALTLDLSVGQAAGFDPQVEDDAFVIALSSSLWSRDNYPSQQPQTHEVKRAALLDLPGLSRHYDRLLTLSIRDPDSLSQLQKDFLKAIGWYRKGRFEPDPYQRFLSFWVALEHAFVPARNETLRLFEDLPRLSITWRNLEWRPLYHFNNQVFTRLEETPHLAAAADGHSALARWREDRWVLLDPSKVELLLGLDDGSAPQVTGLLERYVEELRRIARYAPGTERAVRVLRRHQRFKLRLLYGLRNRLVHEATPRGQHAELYAEELQAVLEDALRKIAEEALREEPECTTVGELARLLELQPWICNPRVAVPRYLRPSEAGARTYEDLFGQALFGS